MLRKFTSVCATLCLSIALILPVSTSASASEYLSPDTIVTKDNANQVIEYLGLDPSDLLKTNASSDDSITVTVGELQETLNQLRQTPKEVTSTEDFNTQAAGDSCTGTQAAAAGDFCTGTHMIFHQTNLGGSFELSYELAVKYAWNKFTDVNSATVFVVDNDDNPLTTFAIPAGGKTLTATVTNSGGRVELSASVKVDSYLGVGSMGVIKISTTTVNTSKEWTPSQAGIPMCV